MKVVVKEKKCGCGDPGCKGNVPVAVTIAIEGESVSDFLNLCLLVGLLQAKFGPSVQTETIEGTIRRPEPEVEFPSYL